MSAKVTRGGVSALERDKPRSRCRRWMLSCRVDGERKMRRVRGTYREACLQLDEWRAELADAVESADTVGEYMRRWIDWRERSGDVAAETIHTNRYALSAIERTGLASMRLADVTGDDVRSAYLEMKSSPARGRALTGATMALMHKVLSAAFRQAEADGVIARTPMRGVKAPKVDTAERDALSPAQVMAALDAVDDGRLDGHTVAVALMLALGLRIGEACGLQVADVDGGVVHVRHRLGDDGLLHPPKTSRGVRDLPMPARLQATLARWRAERIARGYGDAAMLCCDECGREMTPSKMRDWWNAHRDEYGCSGMVPHQLRHSNLSMMARHMPSAFDLQRWAGWSSLEPARVYIHDDRDALATAVSCAFGYDSVAGAQDGGSSGPSSSAFHLVR